MLLIAAPFRSGECMKYANKQPPRRVTVISQLIMFSHTFRATLLCRRIPGILLNYHTMAAKKRELRYFMHITRRCAKWLLLFSLAPDNDELKTVEEEHFLPSSRPPLDPIRNTKATLCVMWFNGFNKFSSRFQIDFDRDLMTQGGESHLCIASHLTGEVAACNVI